MKLLRPGRLERLREGPADLRQGVGPHRRRAALRPGLTLLSAEASCGRAATGRRSITLAVLLVVGFLVLLPLVFLVEESLNVGDPMAFPPVEFGIANYVAIFERGHATSSSNTVIIAVMATVMAILIGFTLAWILTRTNVPGRDKLERLMELPYYMTPLVGALAWAVIAGPKSGFINQLWKAAGGTRRHRRHLHPFRHRLGDGAVRGHGRLRHDLGVDEVDGSRARGIGPRHGRLQAAHDAHRHPAAGHAGRAGRHAVRVRRDAGLVRRRPGARHSRPHLRHHHGDLGSRRSAYPPDYGRASAMGLALFVVMFGMLTFYRRVIGRGSFATITGKAFRPRPMDMGRLAWVLFSVCAALRRAGGGAADRGAAHDLAAALRHR